MGYLKVDNRLSGGQLFETDTQACPHCQGVIDKRKWRMDGGIYCCSRCKKPLCHNCSDVFAKTNGECKPWQQKIEEQLREIEMILKTGGVA